MFTENYCGRNEIEDWTTTDDVSEKIFKPDSAVSQLSFCDKSSDESYLPIKTRALYFDRVTQSHEIVSTIPVFSLKQMHSG